MLIADEMDGEVDFDLPGKVLPIVDRKDCYMVVVMIEDYGGVGDMVVVAE